MKKLRFVVDIGASYTSIYHNGLVLQEPTVAVVRKSNGLELLSAGIDAYDYVGKLDAHSSFIKPVVDGAIVNGEVAALMLSYFFKKAIPRIFFRGVEIIVAISVGLSIAEREIIETTIAKTGYKDITLKEGIMGLLPQVNPEGQAVILIGGGISEIAVISDSGIIAGCSLNLGGQNIDEKIAERVLDTYNLRISARTAEQIKIKLGSLYENDMSTMMIIGKDILDNKLKEQEISAECIKAPIAKCYKTIMEVTESLLTTIPPQLISKVTARGVHIAGGGAKIQGLQDFMSRYLKIPIHIDAMPEISAIKGLYHSK